MEKKKWLVGLVAMAFSANALVACNVQEPPPEDNENMEEQAPENEMNDQDNMNGENGGEQQQEMVPDDENTEND
ncbi:hypothetical protein FZC66_13560 [Priestia megaterium]|nr:hypothetical protein FZC66_13560 [Priestia megaterium]